MRKVHPCWRSDRKGEVERIDGAHRIRSDAHLSQPVDVVLQPLVDAETGERLLPERRQLHTTGTKVLAPPLRPGFGRRRQMDQRPRAPRGQPLKVLGPRRGAPPRPFQRPGGRGPQTEPCSRGARGSTPRIQRLKPSGRHEVERELARGAPHAQRIPPTGDAHHIAPGAAHGRAVEETNPAQRRNEEEVLEALKQELRGEPGAPRVLRQLEIADVERVHLPRPVPHRTQDPRHGTEQVVATERQQEVRLSHGGEERVVPGPMVDEEVVGPIREWIEDFTLQQAQPLDIGPERVGPGNDEAHVTHGLSGTRKPTSMRS